MDEDYFCTKCKIKIEFEEGYIVCPECGSGENIVDYGDFGDYGNIVLGDGKFNWNKK